MKKYIILILSAFLLTSCNSQENKNGKMEILVNFYPSSGGDAVYLINLKNNKLIIKNNEPIDAKEVVVYKKNLSDDKLVKLEKITKSIIKRKDVEADVILDSWRVELMINGVKYYNESDVTIETLPKDIKELIKYLSKDSSVKIDLYGFS